MTRTTTAALLLVLLLAAAPAGGQQDRLGAVRPDSAGLAPAALEAATELLSSYVADGKVAGAVAAVSRDGYLGYLQAVGYQNVESRAPMTARSLFRIYSMTKPVTAVAVMMLHEEGRFELSDPVSRYLSEFEQVRVASGDGDDTRPPSRPITIEDLLLHTSGLSHRSSELYQDARVRDRNDDLHTFVTRIVQPPLMEDPGTRFRYSEAPTVLGRLVEVWSGQRLDVFLRERIFSPLGMFDTGFFVGPAQESQLTTVYRNSDGMLTPFEIEEVPFTDEDALMEGAVGLVSTVPDFLRFAQMLLSGGELNGMRLLEESTVRMMTRNGLAGAALESRGGATGWGLGNVSVVLDPAGANYPASVGEYGWNGSAGTVFWNDPNDGAVIVLMTQSSPANPDSLQQRFKAAVEAAIP
jgi:CubicO group peptidase (beta-lactamase class C family)